MTTALALRINERLFYGWLMLGVGGLGIFASGPAQSFIFSVYLTPLSEGLQLSHTSVSSAYAFATLLAAFGLPYTGRLIDRLGARKVMLGISFLFGLAAIAFSTVQNLVMLSLGFMLLRFLGQGSLMLSCNNLVSQWFSRQRGFALSLMGLGFSLSIAIYPPLANWLIELVGWRESWIWLGLLTWLLLLPPILAFVHSKPEALGLQPDGKQTDVVLSEQQRLMSDVNVGLTLQQALRTSAFWVLAGGMGTLSMLITALFFYQVPIFVNHGLDKQAAANLFSITALSMVIFMPVHGRLLDRLPTHWMFAWALLLTAASMVSIIFVDSIAMAMAYGVLFGMNNAALHTVISYVWPRYFGRKHLGSIQGAAQTIGVVGASIGPIPFGIAFDLFGSYSGALLIFALQPLLLAVLVLLVRAPDLKAAGQPD